MVVVKLEEGYRNTQTYSSTYTWRIPELTRADLTVEFIRGTLFNGRMDQLYVKVGSKVLLSVSFPKIYWWSAADE